MTSVPLFTARPLVRFASNALSLLTSDALNKATTLVVYLMLSRYLTPVAFGQLSLGLLLFYTFQIFAAGGLPTVVTRAVAQRHRRAARYFSNAMAVVATTSLVATSAMVLFALAMQYGRDTTAVLCILSLGLFPFAAANVTEAMFRGWERMHLIAVANVPVNIAKVAGAYWLFEQGYGVLAIAALLVACRVAILAIESALLWVALPSPLAPVRLRFARRLLARSSTFLGIDGLIAIWASIDAVLLSKFHGEAATGLFNAACQLMVPAHLCFHSVISSAFPAMCRRANSSLSEFKEFVRWLLYLLMAIAVPMSVALFFLAEEVLLLLYGKEDYLAATTAVRLLTGVLLLRALTSTLGHALWAGARERITLRIVGINVLMNLCLGLLLIPPFGVAGAAVAVIVTWCVNAWQHALVSRQLFSLVELGRSQATVVAAGAAMALCFAALQSTSTAMATIVAVAVYLSIVSLQLWSKYDRRANLLAPSLE